MKDNSALIFSILLPVLFLIFFGSIYKNSSIGKISVIEVGPVPLLTQTQAHDPAAAVLTITRNDSLTAALTAARKGADVAVLQHGGTLIVRYSIADQTKAGIVNSVLGSIVQDANQLASGQRPRYVMAPSQVEDTSLKPIQYFTPWPARLGAGLRRDLRCRDHAGGLA